VPTSPRSRIPPIVFIRIHPRNRYCRKNNEIVSRDLPPIDPLFYHQAPIEWNHLTIFTNHFNRVDSIGSLGNARA
jgi:hypothetical protein